MHSTGNLSSTGNYPISNVGASEFINNMHFMLTLIVMFVTFLNKALYGLNCWNVEHKRIRPGCLSFYVLIYSSLKGKKKAVIFLFFNAII